MYFPLFDFAFLYVVYTRKLKTKTNALIIQIPSASDSKQLDFVGVNIDMD